MSNNLSVNDWLDHTRMTVSQRNIDEQSDGGCAQGRWCLNYNKIHRQLWHKSDKPALDPHPLLKKIGDLPELVSNILSHLDNNTLFHAATVSKKWHKEAVRFLWHILPCEGRLLAAALADDRVAFYAALVRHMDFTSSSNRNDWGYPYPISATRVMPVLPCLTSLTCEEYSLSRRSADDLVMIFVPTLKKMKIGDDVAFEHFHNHQVQLPNVSWFAIMAANCQRLTSVTLGRNSYIKSHDFDRFVEGATYLQAVHLGGNNEHLLVDRLVPILKSTEVSIRNSTPAINAYIHKQLPKMHALEYLDIKIANCDMTGKDLLRLKPLSKLKRLNIARSLFVMANTTCTATPEELVELVEAMPDLNAFGIWVPCKCLEDLSLLTRDWRQDFTHFPARTLRHQYLAYLHKVIEKKLKSALADFGHLPFCYDHDA